MSAEYDETIAVLGGADQWDLPVPAGFAGRVVAGARRRRRRAAMLSSTGAVVIVVFVVLLVVAATGGNGGGGATYPTSGGVGFAPTVHVGSVPNGIAINPATHTAYVANGGDSTLSVIDTRKCAAPYAASCPTTVPTIHGVDSARGVAVDVATDTVYVTDDGSKDIISVIDGATCNASITTGCGQTPTTVAVGQVPYGIVLDSAAHTVYVANSSSDTVSVIDTRNCRAGNTAGCSQTPASVKVGIEPLGITLDETTHTVYVANVQDNTLSLIDTRTCQATDTTGCGAAMPTVAAGEAPRGVAIDSANGTLYVADVANEMVAILDASTCRASNTSGCSQTPRYVSVGASPDAIAISPDDRTVYVANLLDNTVSLIDTSACNSQHLAALCTVPAPILHVGHGPSSFAFDPSTHTVYVTNGYGPGQDDSVSLLSPS
jgi:YVTN family beta-propeller protein